MALLRLTRIRRWRSVVFNSKRLNRASFVPVGKKRASRSGTWPKRGAIGVVPTSESGSRSGGFAGTWIQTFISGVLSSVNGAFSGVLSTGNGAISGVESIPRVWSAMWQLDVVQHPRVIIVQRKKKG